ncbi:DUF397 domain-containing protein [Streptomyces sp. 8K308]|uniref:DUF397 domain-containing protein n=1 Tax=Streptomyces sp. 8K308 TaxID=2530388 RepID=UPI00104559D9|nr:DUF397 domain-containing protein [Streptomyces sp. 8K308]TDC21405.1 DUF397 domain-containing protein [Streptomyces sp. 8K308]
MSTFVFHKSSYSNEHGDCVEAATNIPGSVAVRDSKAGTAGPLVRTSPGAWQALLDALGRAGHVT